MYWHNGMNGWGFAFMTISMVVFWGVLILAIIGLFRYLGRSEQRPTTPPAGSSPSSPLDLRGREAGPASRTRAEEVLAERYARGEIDTEEYERRLATLRAASTGASAT